MLALGRIPRKLSFSCPVEPVALLINIYIEN
jgi:hypothetical protein